MANRYSQHFTLEEIFNNKNLKGKIPLINYKETNQNGKISATTNAQTVPTLVYEVARNAGAPFYKPFNPSKMGNSIVISGNLKGSLNEAHEAVYAALKAQESVMRWTVNNADMVRSAIKEGANNKRKYGTRSLLYLRAQSMMEIEGMSKPQIIALMTNIMENIIYGDDFPKTKEAYGAETIGAIKGKSYQELRDAWKRRVGDL